MKRALALLMMGSMVLAGCLHSGTVERIADEEPFELSATEEWRNNTVYADTEYRCDDDSTIALFFVNDGGDDCADGSDENPNGSRADFTCADGSAIPFNQTNDRSSDCADGSDEVATTQTYTITGEIGSEQKDKPSLNDVELRLSFVCTPAGDVGYVAEDVCADVAGETQMKIAVLLQLPTGSDGPTYNFPGEETPWYITYSDNDNDGLLSPGDTYRIETADDTAGLNVGFYDVVAGAEVVSVREAIALRGVCNCIVAPTNWHLDPNPATNICVTCTSSSDCSAAKCLLLKDSNPLIPMPQGCYWSNVFSVGKEAHEPADVQVVE